MVTRSELDKILAKYGNSHYNDPLVVNGITYDSAEEYTQIKRAEAAKKKEEEEKQNKTLSARLDKQSEKYRSKYASPLKGEDLERFMVKDDQNPLGFEEMQELGGFKTNRYNKWTDPYRDRTNAGYVVGKTRLGLSQGLSGAEDAARVALANFVEGSTDTIGEMLQKDINNFGWDENKTFGGNLMANTGNAIKTTVDFANMWSRPLIRGIADNAAKVFGKGKSTEEFTRDLADKITSGNIISNLTRLDEREDALSKEAENHGKITQFAGEVGQAVGGMAPALTTAAVTKNPNLALGIMSASAGGSQAREALESGATIDQAYNALITTATKEALIEKIAGGIPGLGKGAIDDLLKNAIGNRNIVKYLADSLGEGAEEMLSNYLQDYINEGTFDSEEERTTFAELLKSGGVGAAVSAILRVPIVFSNGRIVLRDTGEGKSSLSTENTLANETENGYNISEVNNNGQTNQINGRGNQIFGGEPQPAGAVERNRYGDGGIRQGAGGIDGRNPVRATAQLIRPETKAALDNNSNTPYTPLNLQGSDYAAFSSALEQGRNMNRDGWRVDYKSPEELRAEGAKTFLSDIGDAGIAVKADGDIVGVFSTGQRYHVLPEMMLTALENGGIKLDAYDGKLSDLYTQYGFIPVAKVPFSPEIAAENGWNPEINKTPKWVVAWIHNGDSPAEVARKAGTYSRFDVDDNNLVKLFTDYDDMINYRDSLLANGQQTGNTGTGNGLQAEEANNLSGEDVMNESVSAPEHLFTAAQVLQETGASPQAVAEVLAANGTDQQTINAVISSVFGNQTMEQNQGVVNTSSSLGNNSLNSNLNNSPFDAGNAVERGLSSTLNANPQGTVGQETLNLVNESPNRYYNPVSLEQTQQQAAEALALYENETDAVSDLVGKANENGALTSQEVGAAIALIRKFSESGDYSTAASLVDTLMTTATDMGRAINALKLISKRSPEGLLAWANRQIAAINRNSSKPVELTEKDIADITTLGEMIQNGNLDVNMDGTSSSFQKWIGDLKDAIDDGTVEKANVKVEDVLTAKAASIVSEKKPSKFLDKFRALQRIGMLIAPKTHLKNIIGNASEIGSMEAISPITSLFDRAIGKFTGNRMVEGYNANKRKDFVSGAKEGVNRTALESKLGIDLTGNSKYAMDQQGSKTKIFNEDVKTGNAKADKVLNAFNKGLNEINKGITTGLSYGDSWALYGQYRASLGEIMRLNNMTEETVTAEALDAAWQDALRRTFRDDNWLSRAMAKISQSTGLLGAVTMPFVKTPTNVIKIAMEYSPIGTVEGIYKALYGSKSLRALKKAGGPTMALQREIAQLLAKGFVGTAIMIMGIVAGKLGLVTGDQGSEESKDRNWNQTKGELSSSIRIGNVYIDPSTMQSLSSPFIAGGSSAANREEESNTILPTLGDIAVATLNMGNTALEMPVLQGVQDLLGGQYGETNIGLALAGLAAEGAGQLVPGGTLLSQFAKTFDPYARDTSAPDKTGVEKVLAEGVNNIKAKIPGLRETLPIKYDTLGNPIYNDAGGENLAARAFNQFINPFNTSADRQNDVTEEIDRLYEETKDASIIPTTANKSFSYNGETQKLSAEEVSQWGQTQGETTSNILMNAFNNPQYNMMTNDQKVKLVGDAEEYAREKAKEEYLASQGIKYVRSSSAKWADKIDDLEKQGIDNSKAIFYRAALSGMETTEERAEYLMNDTSLSEAEKTAIYDAFGGVSGGYTDIIDEINFNDENDFMVSLTGSNSATNKYNSWFSSGWSINGHSYDAIDGNMYYDLYKAYNSGSNVDERVNAITQTLVNDYGFSNAYAEQFATDFRKQYAKTLK